MIFDGSQGGASAVELLVSQGCTVAVEGPGPNPTQHLSCRIAVAFHGESHACPTSSSYGYSGVQPLRRGLLNWALMHARHSGIDQWGIGGMCSFVSKKYASAVVGIMGLISLRHRPVSVCIYDIRKHLVGGSL